MSDAATVSMPRSAPSHLDSARGWMTACGAALVVMTAFGTIYSFVAFAEDMAQEFGTGLGPISVVFGITVFLFFGSAVVSGRLYDRFGIMPLLVVGGAMFCAGLIATAQVSRLWHGYVLYGIGLGFGGGLFNAPLFALTATWFSKHRAMAQGLVATGSGLGTMLYVPFAQRLLDAYGWRSGMRWLAAVGAVLLALGLLLIRQPPRLDLGDSRRHVSLVVRTAAFWQMGIAGVLFTICVIGTLGLVIPFAQQDGIAERAAGYLVSAVGLSSIVGRLALTGLARSVGSVRLLKIAFFGLPVAFCLWYAATLVDGVERKLVLLVVFAAVLGVSYGGFVALLGDVTAHLFGLTGIGAVMGLLFFSAGLGALLGPPIMGYTSDAAGDIGLPILMAGVISLAGVIVLAPMSRHPISIPTYTGPADATMTPQPRRSAISMPTYTGPADAPTANASPGDDISMPTYTGPVDARQGVERRAADIAMATHTGPADTEPTVLDRPLGASASTAASPAASLNASRQAPSVSRSDAADGPPAPPTPAATDALSSTAGTAALRASPPQVFWPVTSDE